MHDTRKGIPKRMKSHFSSPMRRKRKQKLLNRMPKHLAISKAQAAAEAARILKQRKIEEALLEKNISKPYWTTQP